MAYTFEKRKKTSNLATDRIIELRPIEGKAKHNTGLVDKTLFTGGNRLHAIQNNGLWILKYDNGSLPGALKQSFTNFNILYRYLDNYFRGRNVEIKEVIA